MTKNPVWEKGVGANLVELPDTWKRVRGGKIKKGDIIKYDNRAEWACGMVGKTVKFAEKLNYSVYRKPEQERKAIMKFEVFGEKEQEKVTRLKLDIVDGGVFLFVVDRDGNMVKDGRILLFQDNGTILLMHGVSKKLGFDLDEDGKVKVK